VVRLGNLQLDQRGPKPETFRNTAVFTKNNIKNK